MKSDWFDSWPLWVKAGTLGTGIVVLVGLFYLLDFHPRFQRIEAYKKEISQLAKINETYRKEILSFKKVTSEELASWRTLSVKLRRRIPSEKDLLGAARLLAEKAVENHLMDVSIKTPSSQEKVMGPSRIASRVKKSVSKKSDFFKAFRLHYFVMKMSYLSSLKDSLAYLDALSNIPRYFLVLDDVVLKKDFPFIRTEVKIRFYYGGKLNVEE